MEETVYKVYWSQVEGGQTKVMSYGFLKLEMTLALRFAEQLRAQQRAGGAISHVVMSCEHPDNTTLMGVAEPNPDYCWKKRRR